MADPNDDRECLAISAPFISFSIARALLLTSCLNVLKNKKKNGGGDCIAFHRYRCVCVRELETKEMEIRTWNMF